MDGAIALCSGRGGAFTDWVRSPHLEYELWLSPTQAGVIQGILERTGTELVWVSTWAHNAATYIEDVLGWSTHRFALLPHPDITGADTDPETGRWWKLDVVERLQAERQPGRFVWSDDDLTPRRCGPSNGGWALACGLLQAADQQVGLTRDLLRETEEHLARG